MSPAARPGWAKRPLGGWSPTAPTSSSWTVTSRRARPSPRSSTAPSSLADVTDEAEMTVAVRAAAEIAPLRTTIHCAGVGWAERTINRDGSPHNLETFRKIVDINLIGTFNVLRLVRVRDEPERSRRQRRAWRHRQHRVGRGVRRTDRTGRVLGVEGRRGRAHAHRRARSLGGRHPGLHDRARPHRHAAPRRSPRRSARRSSHRACSSRSGSASRTTSRRSRWRSCATTT